MFHRITRIAFDILFPPLCMHCGSYLNGHPLPLCKSCYETIIKNTSLFCPICGIRMATNGEICIHGKKDAKPYPYLLGAASRYDDPVVRSCIHTCKYQGQYAATKVLSRLLVEYALHLNPRPAIFATTPTVVPIPLHPGKERERGFNQSALIAQAFAQTMEFAYDELLVKLIDNDPQAKTRTREERFERMHGAFAIPRPQDVQNKNIILIDDVSTSGATLSEAAQTLKAVGAKRILALVIAKA